jgi:hypothetical protein
VLKLPEKQAATSQSLHHFIIAQSAGNKKTAPRQIPGGRSYKTNGRINKN